MESLSVSSKERNIIDPNDINCMIAYGAILKPGSNMVALYKLVAPSNKDTYIQVDYMAETILYWHSTMTVCCSIHLISWLYNCCD